MESLFDSVTVQSMIPQKRPFVMVDALYSYSDTEITAGFTPLANNIFVKNGKFTESGLIEHMAQTVALHTGYGFFLRKEQAPMGYIGSIKEIVIHQLPETGDSLITQVLIVQEFAGVTLVEVSTKLNDKEIAFGQMKTVLAK
ncbi:MAG TPA: hypothetical protein VFQ50_04125 [Flavobacterium sp.]|nr:hypothetical protein [Flavobacterium sp.]